MKAFAALYNRLDSTTKTNEKVAAMADYFERARPADAAWALWFLSGGRPKRLIASGRLRQWAAVAAGIPDWLFEECYDAVGDLAETIALLVPAAPQPNEDPLHLWVEERLLGLRALEEDELRERLLAAWAELDRRQLFVWNKLITGALRVGVSKRLAVRALASVARVDAATLTHRLAGNWRPTAAAYEALFSADTSDADLSRPYPFFLAHPLEGEPAALGAHDDWQAEWKWDGIRAQVVRRGGRVFLWSRGEELVTESFPEVAESARLLPDGCVIDGELMAWKDGGPLPFAVLQRRLGRKKPGPKILADAPAALVAYDLLEWRGEDYRSRPLGERRSRLTGLLDSLPATDRVLASPVVAAADWAELEAARLAARERSAEGLMLKRLSSAYGVGRRRGDWWKWKLDPFTLDAVLIYAQRGHGRRASLYTDYTFGVWHEGKLVPIAKAYSGLTDAEIRRVDRFVRRHTTDRFGPVRAVEPELVFEIAFEGIRESKRHKSGIALRFPRMARWRDDKKPKEADTLDAARALLQAPAPARDEGR